MFYKKGGTIHVNECCKEKYNEIHSCCNHDNAYAVWWIFADFRADHTVGK